MSTQSVLNSGFQFEIQSKVSDNSAVIYLLGYKSASQRSKALKEIVYSNANELAQEKYLQGEKKIISFAGTLGHVWIAQTPETKKGNHGGLLDESNYTWYRDLGAGLLMQIKSYQFEAVSLELHDIEPENLRAFIVGLEMAAYNFLSHYKSNSKKIKISVVTKIKSIKNVIETAQLEAAAVQLTRHLEPASE